MKQIDSLMLQRLVDSELTGDEIQTLLHSAEVNPQQWKEIAVAFVENQRWQSEFQRLSGDPPKTVAQPAPAKESAGPSASWWFSMAAGILLALGMGFYFGKSEFAPVGMADATTENSSLETPAVTQTVYRPNYHMRLQDNDGNNMVSSEIPIFDRRTAREAGVDMRPQPISAQLRDQLLQQGYHTSQDVEYVSGRLGDGRKFVVPIRTINFASGQ